MCPRPTSGTWEPKVKPRTCGGEARALSFTRSPHDPGAGDTVCDLQSCLTCETYKDRLGHSAYPTHSS